MNSNIPPIKPVFTRIGIVSKYDNPDITPIMTRLHKHLVDKGYQVMIAQQSVNFINSTATNSVPLAKLPLYCSVIISVGGDGTLLATARAAVGYGTPIVGINLGTLGFLVDLTPDSLFDSLDAILQGQYRKETRSVLQATIRRRGEIIRQELALNEVVIHRWVTPSMIEIFTKVDGKHLNSQRSDGLIISTPTGSTAYALAAGGPIVHPSLKALVLVPLNPQTLSNRPIVISDNSEIEVTFSQKKEIHAQVTCDHLEIPEVHTGDVISIKKFEYDITLLHPVDHDFFHVLREKLKWSGG